MGVFFLMLRNFTVTSKILFSIAQEFRSQNHQATRIFAFYLHLVMHFLIELPCHILFLQCGLITSVFNVISIPSPFTDFFMVIIYQKTPTISS